MINDSQLRFPRICGKAGGGGGGGGDLGNGMNVVSSAQ